MGNAEFIEDLPDDPRRAAWGGEWNAPDGRVSHAKEVEVAGILRVGERTEQLAAGDYIVWQDGEYKVVSRDEFVNDAWDLAGPSVFEFDVLAEQTDESETNAPSNERSQSEG